MTACWREHDVWGVTTSASSMSRPRRMWSCLQVYKGTASEQVCKTRHVQCCHSAKAQVASTLPAVATRALWAYKPRMRNMVRLYRIAGAPPQASGLRPMCVPGTPWPASFEYLLPMAWQRIENPGQLTVASRKAHVAGLHCGMCTAASADVGGQRLQEAHA